MVYSIICSACPCHVKCYISYSVLLILLRRYMPCSISLIFATFYLISIKYAVLCILCHRIPYSISYPVLIILICQFVSHILLRVMLQSLLAVCVSCSFPFILLRHRIKCSIPSILLRYHIPCSVAYDLLFVHFCHLCVHYILLFVLICHRIPRSVLLVCHWRKMAQRAKQFRAQDFQPLLLSISTRA